VDIARFKAAPLSGVVVLILVYVSLFSCRIPVPIQSVLFLVMLLLEITMIVAEWWYCIRNKSANEIPKLSA
jgi:hypothetical protein